MQITISVQAPNSLVTEHVCPYHCYFSCTNDCTCLTTEPETVLRRRYLARTSNSTVLSIDRQTSYEKRNNFIRGDIIFQVPTDTCRGACDKTMSGTCIQLLCLAHLVGHLCNQYLKDLFRNHVTLQDVKGHQS